MAVAPSAAVSPARQTTSKKRKSKEAPAKAEMVTQEPEQESVLDSPKPHAKRTKSPGVRVKGMRVYDSANGKTCHQCRQKTLDFAASCKNMIKGKLCTMKLCHKCLLNRYGEKAEEVSLLDDWKCPKCRGICNCSFCMKKRGCTPTGILIHSAKASGYTSVSAMLDVGGSQEEIAKSKSETVSSPKKTGKENKYDGPQTNASDCPIQSHSKKLKKVKDSEKKDVNEVNNESIEKVLVKKVKKDKSKVKKDKVKESTETCQVNEVKKKNSTKVKKVKESTEASDVDKAKLKELAEVCDAEGGKRALCKAGESGVPEQAPKKKAKLHPILPDVKDEKPNVAEIILPDGSQLTNVAEVDLQAEDVGNALQFIEFCYTFGEVLDIRKGQGIIVLRDIFLGRTKRGRVSPLVLFQIHLLTQIRKDMEEEDPLSPNDGEDCWLNALKDFVTEEAAKDLAALKFDKTTAYELLSSSDKLRLLVFICDEALDTMQVRNYIEEQNLKFSEKKKEAKEKMAAAKEKEKLMKQTLQDKIAKAIIAKNGAPLTISEHETLVSEMKAQSEIAHAEMLETKGLVPRHEQVPTAVRIEPVLVDSKGHAFWRLKGSKLLLRQGLQDRDGSNASEMWSSYEDEEAQVIKEYISFYWLQKRKHNPKRVPKVGNGNLCPNVVPNPSTTLTAN